MDTTYLEQKNSKGESILVTREIVIHTEKCVGCLTCQMRCSFLKDGIFNPLASRIEVARLPTGERLVRFKSDCDHCGVCANFCAYGALDLLK